MIQSALENRSVAFVHISHDLFSYLVELVVIMLSSVKAMTCSGMLVSNG